MKLLDVYRSKYRRSSWYEKHYIARAHDSHIIMMCDSESCWEWKPGFDDIIAEDWEAIL